MRRYEVMIKHALKLQTESEREAVLYLTHRLMADSSLYRDEGTHIRVVDGGSERARAWLMRPRSPLIRTAPRWM